MTGTEDHAPFEPVLDIDNAGDRVFLCSLLDAHRIAYFIQGDTAAPYLFHAVPMRLMVRRDQAGAARRLLANFRPAGAYDGLAGIFDES